MKLTNILSVLVGILISTSVFGQTPESSPLTSGAQKKAEQEIEKKALTLLDETIGQAESLKLPENRVYVFATAGDLLWARDEKRARQLFRRAANEVSAVYQADESEDELPETFPVMQSARFQFLNQVANHNAELAIELLRQTRPFILDQMLNLPATKIPLYGSLYSTAQSDLNLEKQFVAQMIKQNPQRALELARANLNKGASNYDLNLINELRNTDVKAASQFANEVLLKLASADLALANNYNERSLTLSLLSQFSAPPNSAEDDSSEKSKPLQIDKTALQSLAGKYADYFSSKAFQPGNYYEIQNALPVFEKILPERFAGLRQKYERLKPSDSPGAPNQLQEKFDQLSQKATPETMLAEARNFPMEWRSQIYASAVNKTAGLGNYAAARQMITSLPGKQARQNALFQLDNQAFSNYLSQEKYQEAEQIIRQQTDNSQKIRFLVQMTGYLYSKKQNEKALQYVSEAYSMTNPNPEDYHEMFDLMQVLTVSAETAPDKTFALIESFIPKFNEILAANALLSKYQPSSGTFREGEIVLSNGYNGFYISGRRIGDMSVNLNSMRLDYLAKTDLERTIHLAEGFERADVRTAARLIILRGILFDGKTPNLISIY